MSLISLATMDPAPWRYGSSNQARETTWQDYPILANHRRGGDNRRMTDKPDVPPVPLCSLDSLPDPGSKGFVHQGQALFAVRQGQQVFVYENRCPHRGIPLEWVPDQFLDSSERLIQCATHGALFLPESGECVAGPCAGAFLQARASHISDGQLWLD
jgi:nitrite reductase/ring-hydroxylating ferredoxin subunit